MFTACFQRDSVKDRVIVCLFLVLTLGLLGWAALRPVVERLTGRVERGDYRAVEEEGG